MSVCESLLSMVLQSVENVLKKAETLKDQLMNIENIACDKDGMVCQQKLQRIYHDALIRDLEYSLDHKAEVDLWNHGFRNSIVTLQSLARDKKNPKRDESENKLTRFLESATAFYSALLHDVCSAFDLELPFRRNGRSYACPKKILPPKSVTKPNKNSCYYMCQYCLVHLGDLARYRHLGRQAELFYRYAVQLSPCSGHPYNQLALVEAARGDRLSTVFYYVRSVSVRHPFPAAALNLTKTLNQYVDEEIDVEGRAKLTVPECVTVFLRFHGLLSKLTDLEVAEKYVKLLTNTLTALVATESFSATQLVQMLAINLYALHQRRGCAFLNKNTVLSESGLEATELQAKRLVLHLVAGSLSAFLLPVYTLKDGEALLDYFALPAIKLTLDWIHLESSVLNEAAFLTRRQIWPSLCKLLNVIQPYIGNFSVDKWTFVPLPEDKNLQCFIPLERLLNNYRFVFDEPKMEIETTNKLRASRLVEFGVWLSEQENLKLLKTRKDSGVNDKLVFELAYMMPSDLAQKEVVTVQETKDDSLETSTLTDIGSLDSDSTSGIGEGTETQTPPDFFPITLPPTGVKDEELQKNKVPAVAKDNASITTVQTPSPGPGIMKKYRQNVAMQAILKKMDQESIKTAESKQVTFKTPAPAGSEAEKKAQNKQLKGSQDKQSAQQITSKAISIAINTSNDKNKSATASDSVGKNVTFSIHGSQDNTHLQKEKQNAADKVHSSTINFQDKNAAPLIKMGQDTVGGNAFLGGTAFHSPTPQEKSFTLPAQNSQKKSVTFTDEKILSFAAQVFQNRGLAYKGTFPSQVQQDKTSPLSSPAAPEKALPFNTQGVDNKTSTYPVANMKDKPISYSGIVQQETTKQPVTETSTWIFNKNVLPPPPPRDVRASVPPTTQTRTELPGTHIFGGVGSFSRELLKNPLFKLPDLQELRSTPDSNVSSPQLYSPGNALGTDIPKVPQSQYSMEINKNLGSVYTVPDAKTKPDFTNVSSVNNVADSSQLHIPAAIGSEHSAFQSPTANFTHPHSTSRNFPDQMGKVRPPPGYTMTHVPQTPVSWWKEDLAPTSPLTTWWKMDPASGNRPGSHPPGDDSTAIPYSPLSYGRPPSQQLPLNEGAGKTDTGYGNHLWSMGSPSTSVDVNLHHKLVGGTAQQQASFTTSGHQQPPYSAASQQQATYSRPDSSLTGMFTSDVNMPMFGPRDTTERGLPEVTACSVGSYAAGGSLFPMPTRHSGPGGDNTYSLFSSTQWATPSTTQASQPGMSFGGLMTASGSSGLGTQSLWSGPGPSPLERLLEQQKRLREGPASKKGT